MATRREALSELPDDLDVCLGHPRAQYLRFSADAVLVQERIAPQPCSPPSLAG